MKRSGSLRHIGKVGRRRLATVAELRKEAVRAGWIDICELRPILLERGLLDQFNLNCLGDLEFCHSEKTSPRGSDPVLDKEVCRGCTLHHHSILDLLRPAETAEIVREAIRRRKERDG